MAMNALRSVRKGAGDHEHRVGGAGSETTVGSGRGMQRLTRAQKLRAALLAQGAYFVATGVAPFVSRRAFEAITGPKPGVWLVETVGVLASASEHEPRSGQEYRHDAQRNGEATARHRYPASPARAPRVIRHGPEEPASTTRPARRCAICPPRWPASPTPSTGEPTDRVGAGQPPE
jgi:hypothetical protein